MAYFLKEKINLEDLAAVENFRKAIVIVEPEEYLLDLYCEYFNRHNFHVRGCGSIDLLEKLLEQHRPHLLIINVGFLLKAGSSFLAKNSQDIGFKILSIGYNTDLEAVKKIMPLGVAAHIDRRTTKPQDVVDIALAMLNE